MRRRLLLPIVLGAGALAVAAQTQAMSAPKLKGTVGPGFTIKLVDSTGKKVTSLHTGKYTFVVTDNSKTQSFRLDGPGVHRHTSVKGTGRSTWTLALRKGKYTFRSGGRGGLRGTFRVV